jgi:hypothetical protein
LSWLIATLWLVVFLTGGYLLYWLGSRLGSMLSAPQRPLQGVFDEDTADDIAAREDRVRQRSIEATRKFVDIVESDAPSPDAAEWGENVSPLNVQVRQRVNRA